MREAYKYIATGEGQAYENIVLDSLSEIAEQILSAEKAVVKDARLAYLTLGDQVISLTKAFRDLPGKNVVLIAKSERQRDEATGTMLYSPSFPGSKIAQAIPFLVDEVFFYTLNVEKTV